MYELNEALLAPEGSDVQCTRCQHVFTARPPTAPGQTLQGIPLTQVIQPAAEPPASPPPSPTPTSSPARSSAAQSGDGHPVASVTHQAPRYTPGSPGPTVYRPPISQPTVTRPPLIRRDTVGTFESRLRWSHRWKWLAPSLFFGLVALGVVGFLARESIVDPRARSAQARALELALRDDVASLEGARAQLDEALRLGPRLHAARADRALIELLLAGVYAEQSLLASGPGTDELRRKARELTVRSVEALDLLEQARLAPAEVARARTAVAALGTDRAELKRFAASARGLLGDDPIVQALEGSADVRSSDRATRDQAVERLAALGNRRPDVLRARYALARGRSLAGRRTEALATVEALLKANPRHESALTLRETLVRAAPSRTESVPAPQVEARVEKPGALSRKADSTGEEPQGIAPVRTTASPGSPPPPARLPPPPTADSTPSAGALEAVPGGTDRAAGQAEPPLPVPRLRPAAVPEPEPVQGGG